MGQVLSLDTKKTRGIKLLQVSLSGQQDTTREVKLTTRLIHGTGSLPGYREDKKNTVTQGMLHSQILITSGTRQPVHVRVLHHLLLKDTGGCVHGQ